jgi:hypothetical protein
MIDNRIVDMKPAVPEGSGSGMTSPTEASFTPKMFPGHADLRMGMLAGQGYGAWPDATGSFCNPSLMWSGGKTSPTNQGLDCADLLTAARELAAAHSSPNGLLLQSMGAREYGDFAASDPLDILGLTGSAYGSRTGEQAGTLIPEEFQQPAGGRMSASAPEFVPSGTQAAAPSAPKSVEKSATPAVGVTPPQTQKSRNRAPLGELTNIVVEVGDLLKPFESPSNKLAGVGHGHLSAAYHSERPDLTSRPSSNEVSPSGLLLGDEMDSSSPSSSSDAHLGPPSPDTSSPEPESVDARAESQEVEEEDKLEDNKGPDSPTSTSNDNGSESDLEGSSVDGEPVVVDLDSLPSIGSAQHATGECKRCNFFPKGRCQNGKNCTFCHYPHDKRKPSRQEKRERRAAWLDQQGEDIPHGQSQEEVHHHHAAGMEAVLSAAGLQQGCFPVYTDEDIFSGETLAYSIFPGLPPIHATKLPAPLPLPGMDMTSRSGPALPPGLAPPALGATQPWQPEAESSPAAHGLLSTGHTNCQQVVSSISRTSVFATVPTPLRTTPASTAASTPMPTPVPTPTAMRTSAEGGLARSLLSASATSSTQTGDYMCNKCQEEFQELDEAATDASSSVTGAKGQQWSREELLRLRDGLAMMFETSEIGKAKILPHTMAITATSSI